MQNGWFGPQKIGWGVSPVRWQGWLVSVLIVAGLASAMRWLRPVLEESTGLPGPALTFAIVAFWVALYAAVIWLTYERSGRKT